MGFLECLYEGEGIDGVALDALFKGMEGVVSVSGAENAEKVFMMEDEVGEAVEYVVALVLGVEDAGEVEELVVLVVDEVKGPGEGADIDEELAGLEVFGIGRGHGFSPF